MTHNLALIATDCKQNLRSGAKNCYVPERAPLTAVEVRPTMQYIAHMAVGDRIREAREAAGMTLKELAKLSGVSKRQIGYIESGASEPKVSTARALVIALNTPGLLDEEINGPLAKLRDFTPADRAQLETIARDMMRTATRILEQFSAEGRTPGASVTPPNEPPPHAGADAFIPGGNIPPPPGSAPDEDEGNGESKGKKDGPR